MSSDFYFMRWKEILSRLQIVIANDVDYQSTKAHDKTLCEAVYRLTGVLAQYLAVYKDALECVQLNLQVQKTVYLELICNALMDRITELKSQIKKSEVSEYQFFGNGLIKNKLMTLDIEIDEVYPKPERAEDVQEMLDEAFRRVAERLVEEQKALEGLNKEVENLLWDDDVQEEAQPVIFEEPKYRPTEEELEIRRHVTLIQAQERSRQVVMFLSQQRIKLENWTKQLEGSLSPPAPLEVRERSARLIQKVFRKYFKVKRQRIVDCKRDQLLDLRLCLKPKTLQLDNVENIKESRYKRKRKYEAERDAEYEKIKQKLLKFRRDDIIEHYRDFTRDWFRLWYDQIQFFNDIPDDKQGGIVAILNGDTQEPHDWLEEYKKYLAVKESNKKKSASELKFAKQEAKQQQLMEKREQAMKDKLQQQLLNKMMKNPNLHPGFDYPPSNKIDQLLKAIEQYHQVWDDLDASESEEVKKRFIEGFNYDDACRDVKKQLAEEVVEDMRNEVKLLMKALKTDYENMGERMPVAMEKKKKKEKKEQKLKKIPSGNLVDKIEDLVTRGYIKKYEKTKLRDFIGDPNFAGEEIKCDYRPADPLNGETRQIWWERCRQMVRGFQKVLLVGPEQSGKTLLVHALASINGKRAVRVSKELLQQELHRFSHSLARGKCRTSHSLTVTKSITLQIWQAVFPYAVVINNAVLFELDPMKIPGECINAEYLGTLVNSLCICAKALQPSVIYIRQIQKLYYRKVPHNETEINFKLLKKYLITKLFKKINKNDKITVIGACVDPWVTNAKILLKIFPTVVMMPETSYSLVVQLLKDWVLSNHTIPPELDVSSLAFVLRHFTIGYIKQALKDFLTAERLVKIKAFGLSPMEIYSYIIENKNEDQIDYTKYKKWYTEKTVNGQKENKHISQQAMFKQALDLFAERSKKKSKSAPGSVASSVK